MKIKPIIIALTIATAGVSIPLAHAETWMEDYYNQAGASMNATGPGAYQSQAGNVITGGGLSVKIPPKNIQLYNFSPPSLKKGCGGIDLWAGSFGFINKAQFVAFARNIGQNSLAYFFDLALKTIAPEVESTISKLQAMAQKMNDNSLNACEVANRMVNVHDAPEVKAGASFTERMEGLSTALGTVSDRVGAVEKYGSDLVKTFEDLRNVKATTPTAILNSGGQEQTPIGDYNLVYRALTASGPSVFTEAEINLIISLTGTILVKTPIAGGSNEIVNQHIPPTIANLTDFIGNRTATTNYKLNVCDSSGSCLSMTQENKSAKSFAFVAHEKITKIRDKIRDEQAQDASVVDYLEQSSVPIYRLLSSATRPQRIDISQSIVDTYADAIAVDLTSSFIKTLTAEVIRKSATLSPSPAEKTELDSFKKNLITLQTNADVLLQEKQMKLAEKAHFINVVEQYDRALNKALGKDLMANLAFR